MTFISKNERTLLFFTVIPGPQVMAQHWAMYQCLKMSGLGSPFTTQSWDAVLSAGVVVITKICWWTGEAACHRAWVPQSAS